VDRVDAPALELLAVHCARIAQARHVVAAHGHFARGSAGQVRQHPALRIEREATKLFLMLAEEFRLDGGGAGSARPGPASRPPVGRELDGALGSPTSSQVA